MSSLAFGEAAALGATQLMTALFRSAEAPCSKLKPS
jgi:hypothetical protein